MEVDFTGIIEVGAGNNRAAVDVSTGTEGAGVGTEEVDDLAAIQSGYRMEYP